MTDELFRELVWQKSRELYRDMPWRQDTRPYYILVSELMLQQTQVSRVVPKFEAFVRAFPDEGALARASLADVLKLWQGLGYNRRAKYLHDAAKMIGSEFGSVWPDTVVTLTKLPGVGKNTAGAIMAYAYNKPSVFIETNIRTVYFFHFFSENDDVTDAQIQEKLETTIDKENPREFYWALMDYGYQLKSEGLRNNSQSKGYKKQTPLEGSLRQTRGHIIAVLAVREMTKPALFKEVRADERFDSALKGLIRDGLVELDGDILHLTK